MKRQTARVGLLALVALTTVNSAPAHADDDLWVGVGAQLFATWEARFGDGASTQAFDLPRAEVGVTAGWGPWIDSELRIEGVRSAEGQSLFGVAGNSLVVRIKRAFGRAAYDFGVVRLALSGGMIADPWIESLESGYDVRAIAPTLSEQTELFDTSDLGGRLEISALDHRLRLNVAAHNGEGRNQVEQNDGKNLTVVLSGDPWVGDLWGAEARLALHAVFRDGSLGPASIRDQRFGGAVTFAHPRLGAGAEVTFAEGVDENSDTRSMAMGAWANGSVLNGWLGFYGRFDMWNRDQDVDDATQTIIRAGLYCDPITPHGWAGRMRLYAGWEMRSHGVNAGPIAGVPEASDTHAVMVTLEVAGDRRF